MKKILLFLPVILLLCGCGHKENYSIIKGIGFETENDSILVSASCAKIDEEAKLYQAKGKSTAEALDQLLSQAEETPYFEQNELILLSGELSKEETKMILHGYFSKDKRKGSEWIVYTDTKTDELFEAFSAEDILRQMETAKKNTSVLPCTISSFIAASEGTGSAVLIPAISLKNDKLCLDRSVIFKDYAYVDSISADALQAVLFVMGDAEDIVFSIDAQDEAYCLQVDKQKLDIAAFIGENGPHFSIKTDVTLTVIGRSDMTNQNIDVDLIAREAEKQIKSKMEQILKIAVIRQCDFLNLAARTLNTDEKLFRAYQKDWENALSMADFDVEISCNIKVSGIITQPEEPEE
ncbi:MAG: hypothetical protein E7332_04375 [Clostridiales bacterium]|nr:hypothetical protein [Clostridiales bacterium]